jgi:hypothetical protein
VLPVASGWFVAITVVLTTAFWLGLFFAQAPRRGGLVEMIGRGGFFMRGFGTLAIEYNGKFHD